ncbi:hypothetical protein J1N35_036453 [Gossypium stocksii]|uniref:DUF4283 domain-containing protein n=1 Tax=Gossypium stocksii TaxID=47602 RepID=A0A9D3UIZ1_9ROSI|nr:hypothetical protein J1N35_036453 [Gossypium stocksii]
MRSGMANLWHPLRGVQISNLGDKRFLFQVFHKMDIDRVLNGDPWTFNNHLLVIHRLEDGEDPMKVPPIYMTFWVQVHDLPLGFFTESIAKKLGDFMDHCPLLNHTELESNRLMQKRFQSEAWWVMEECFEEEVKQICQSTSGDMLAKLERVRKGLVRWVGFVRNNRESLKRDLTRKLKEMMGKDRGDENIVELS